MSWRLTAGLIVALCGAVAFARLLQDPESGVMTWDAARASGFAGYLLLWASVMTGMALHLRFRPFGGPLTFPLEGHRIVSALAFAFTVVHVFALVLDPLVHFSPVDVLVPYAAGYRPFQVGMGTLAQWLLVVVLATTAMTGPQSISYYAWRRFHYLSFPAWLLAFLHGVFAGTDASARPALVIYAGSASLLAGLFVIRLYGRATATSGERLNPSS